MNKISYSNERTGLQNEKEKKPKPNTHSQKYPQAKISIVEVIMLFLDYWGIL